MLQILLLGLGLLVCGAVTVLALSSVFSGAGVIVIPLLIVFAVLIGLKQQAKPAAKE